MTASWPDRPMADTVTPDVRSRMMSAIRSKNTGPELALRCGLHALGFRFRINDRTLPGSPDIVFPKYRAVIFAHGCFWHGHDCALFRLPATRTDFWRSKIDGNRVRDAANEQKLIEQGWRALTVWECGLRGKGRLPLEEVIASCAAWLRDGTPSSSLSGTV